MYEKSLKIKAKIVSATDVQKNWTKIIQHLKDGLEPIFVCTDSVPDAVILSFDEFQKLQEIIEFAHREQFGQTIANDLIDLAKLTHQPIKRMYLNTDSVFEEIKSK